MTRHRARIGAVALSTLAAAGVLAGCSANDPPPSALCKNIASLSSAVSTIGSTPVSKSSLPTLTASLKQLRSALDGLASAASAEFSSEIKAVESSATALKSSLAQSTVTNSAANRSQVQQDRSAFASAVKDLSKATSSSC